MFCETGNVHFINHGARERPSQRFIAFPIVAAQVRNHAFHGCATVIAGTGRSAPAVIRRAGNGTAIGVEQYLLVIESQPLFRNEGPIDSVTVNLSNSDPGYEDVPIVTTAIRNRIERDRSRRVSIVHLLEQQQLHGGTAFREDAEIHAARIHSRTERKTITGRNYGVHHFFSCLRSVGTSSCSSGGPRARIESGISADEQELVPIDLGFGRAPGNSVHRPPPATLQDLFRACHSPVRRKAEMFTPTPHPPPHPHAPHTPPPPAPST